MAEIRSPAAIGFYRPDAKSLREQIEWAFQHRLGPRRLPQVNPHGLHRLLGLVSPHAGYQYSGPAAACGYAALAEEGRPETVVMIGPNHHGLGKPLAVSDAEGWRTPLGVAQCDIELAQAIAKAVPGAELDSRAHREEHSLEVQVPFLQYLFGEEVRLVALALQFHLPDTPEVLGQALAKVLSGRQVVLIASTDMTHQEPQEVAAAQDQKALEAMLRLDPPGLLEVVRRQRISMCGSEPTALVISACRALGATRAELLKYHSSGDTEPGMNWVVGYASVAIWKDPGGAGTGE